MDNKELKVRFELEPNVLGMSRLTHLEFEVSHDEGGYSYGTGEYRGRGITLNVSPLEIQVMEYSGRKHNVYGHIYDGDTRHQGFYVFLIETGRRSPKKMQKAFDTLRPHFEKMRDLFIAGNYCEIARLAKELVH